jgi:hypothetical protein
MEAMTRSAWHIGTYELLIQDIPEDRMLCVTVFAKPVDVRDEPSDLDAPILAQVDVGYGEVGVSDGPKPWPVNAFRDVGEHGLAPEDFEAEFGAQMALRALLALFQAADRDFRGVDMDARPWRHASMGAFAIMQRTSDLMILLKTRLYEMG